VNTKKYTLDRFEADKAVLLLRSNEAEELIIEKEKVLPADEGDILKVSFTGRGEFYSSKVLVEETKQAREKANELLKKLLNKND
jgi:hypothetical protein